MGSVVKPHSQVGNNFKSKTRNFMPLHDRPQEAPFMLLLDNGNGPIVVSLRAPNLPRPHLYFQLEPRPPTISFLKIPSAAAFASQPKTASAFIIQAHLSLRGPGSTGSYPGPTGSTRVERH